nr:hypothetical protein [Spiroplasma phoeniceum]
MYIDGTSPHDEKKVHSSKIPWIVLARTFWIPCVVYFSAWGYDLK